MSVLSDLAHERTQDVIYSALSVMIERFAAEACREILRDPALRKEITALTRISLTRTLRSLRQNGQPKARRRRTTKKKPSA